MFRGMLRADERTIVKSDWSQVALKERGVDKLVADAREDNKENDARLNASKSKPAFLERVLFIC